MFELVFDLETQNSDFSFDNTGLKEARISVVGVYDYADNEYKTFMEEEFPALWKLFEAADRIISYNGIHFDVPVLNNYYPGDLSKIPHMDLIVPVKEALGFRLKLNDLAKATLKIEKSADGLQAVKWWEEGKIDEIKKYCLQDVKVTKELYEFGKKNKQLFYPNLQGEIIPFAVNFEPPIIIDDTTTTQQASQSNINLTLPL